MDTCQIKVSLVFGGWGFFPVWWWFYDSAVCEGGSENPDQQVLLHSST